MTSSCRLLIKRILHFVDGRLEALLAAERIDKLDNAAHRGEGRHLQDVGVVQIKHSLVAVFFE